MKVYMVNKRVRYGLGGVLILLGLWFLALALARGGYNYPQPSLVYVRNGLLGLGIILMGITHVLPRNRPKLRITIDVLGLIAFIGVGILWII